MPLLEAQPPRSRVGYALVVFAAASWGTWPLILRHVALSATLQAAVMLLVLTVVSLPLMLRDRVRVRPPRNASPLSRDRVPSPP